jgi:hypothetical protein
MQSNTPVGSASFNTNNPSNIPAQASKNMESAQSNKV